MSTLLMHNIDTQFFCGPTNGMVVTTNSPDMNEVVIDHHSLFPSHMFIESSSTDTTNHHHHHFLNQSPSAESPSCQSRPLLLDNQQNRNSEFQNYPQISNFNDNQHHQLIIDDRNIHSLDNNHHHHLLSLNYHESSPSMNHHGPEQHYILDDFPNTNPISNNNNNENINDNTTETGNEIPFDDYSVEQLDCPTNSWLMKPPDQWLPSEVAEWIRFWAQRNQVQDIDVAHLLYNQMAGLELCQMQREYFTTVCPQYGDMIYDSLQTLQMNHNNQNQTNTTTTTTTTTAICTNNTTYSPSSSSSNADISQKDLQHNQLNVIDLYSTTTTNTASTANHSEISSLLSSSANFDPQSNNTTMLTNDSCQNHLDLNINMNMNTPDYTNAAAVAGNASGTVGTGNSRFIDSDDRDSTTSTYTSGSIVNESSSLNGASGGHYFSSSASTSSSSSSSSYFSSPTSSSPMIINNHHNNNHHHHHNHPISTQNTDLINISAQGCMEPPNIMSTKIQNHHHHHRRSGPSSANNNNTGIGRRGRPPKKENKSRSKGNGKLWEFIRDLLLNPVTNPSLIRWERQEDGIFKFIQSDKVAKMWGERKQNPRMTYEKLSRAMRYYYKSQVLLPVFGRRLVYKFGPNATGWRPLSSNTVNNNYMDTNAVTLITIDRGKTPTLVQALADDNYQLCDI